MNSTNKQRKIAADKGLLYYLVKRTRPKLAEYVSTTGTIETIVIGLGRQGTKHAGLMCEYGTDVTAAVAAGRGDSYVHETIPVYNNVGDCLAEHPNIVAASIWRHYSKARDAATEAIEAGIPIVVLITEWIPLRDVRDIIHCAREHDTLLLGGNTPGIIFPPEGIKIGMLPDVFYPSEPSPGVFGPEGVTIVSRSGAILYHLSDALASSGIAQNAVIGVGGDGAIGSTFTDLVPLFSAYENTDLVVVAGEIGGCQEEVLARDVKENVAKYPKPIVALISGARAPEGKTMGHAGAIVAPGQSYGTFASKTKALTQAGIKVVNSQYDLIKEVKAKLKRKTYFRTDRYYKAMAEKWEAKPEKPSWGTLVTKVEPNLLMISGYMLTDLIEHATFLETAYLLVAGKLPEEGIAEQLAEKAVEAVKRDSPQVEFGENEDISKYLAKCVMMDAHIPKLPQKTKKEKVEKTIFTIGRMARYLFSARNNLAGVERASSTEPFSYTIFRALTGENNVVPAHADMLEKMVIASVDHGVTPPSTQAALIVSSARGEYEQAIAAGISAITNVHGGAGAAAAVFFARCIDRAEHDGIDTRKATQMTIEEIISSGKRIKGLGHRVHTEDPRRDALWKAAKQNNISSQCVEISTFVGEVFKKLRGMNLPINVDGVIGAIVADMKLPPSTAKALFVYGRVAGLSAHYFEEISCQPEMRRIDFAQAVYKGPERMEWPHE